MAESVSILPIKRPTLKQINFFRALKRTHNPTEAALIAYKCKSREVAQVLGSKTMRALNVSLTEALNLCGLDITQDLEDIRRLSQAKKLHGKTLIEVDDNTTQLETLKLRLRVKGEIRERFEGEVIHKHVHFFQEIVERSSAIPEAIKNHIETEASEVKDAGQS